MKANVPFDGFYESIPDSIIDDAITLMVSDSRGDAYAVDVWGEINCSQARQVVAEMWTENFFQAIQDDVPGMRKITIPKAVEIDSPREYNFTTDRLFVDLTEADAVALFAVVDKSKLDDGCREHLTSRSGFISYYDPDYTAWGEVPEWDANQLGMLLLAVAEQFFERDWRMNLCDDMDSNGDVSDALYEGLTAEGRRIVKVTDYLRSREERECRQPA